jgi:NAD+ synthase (glutamine-hydrolysing)
LSIPIHAAFSAMLSTLEGAFKGLSQVSLKKIFAAARQYPHGPSNKFGWLVLTTGNKSELATGYATSIW